MPLHPRSLPQAKIDRIRRLCEIHPETTVAAIVRVDLHTIVRIGRRGWVEKSAGRPVRPRPTDFAIMAGRMTIRELCAHYRAGTMVVYRWIGEVGRTPMRPEQGDKITRPRDFAEVLARIGPTACKAHYGVTFRVVARWRQEIGHPIRGREKSREKGIGWVDRYAATASHSVEGHR